MTTPTRPDSWSRRISNNAHLPQLPSVFGLRDALLGYLGEVEQALRSKLGEDQQLLHDHLSQSGESTGISSDDQEMSFEHDERAAHEFGSEGLDQASSSGVQASGSARGESTLRHRSSQLSTSSIDSTGTSASTGTATAGANTVRFPTSTTNHDPNLSLLQHLTSVREDVRAYLPNRISLPGVPALPSMPALPTLPRPQMPVQLNREWLRSLPGKLSIVDLGVSPSSSSAIAGRSTSGSGPGPTSSGKGKLREVGDGDHGHDRDGDQLYGIHAPSVENARKKVIELVHALLPSEDWAGWEKLGWEEQDWEDDGAEAMGMRRPVPTRSRSASASLALSRARARERAMRDRDEALEVDDKDQEDDSDIDEADYLFPNMTPASAHAHAVVRGRNRSISLSAGTLNAQNNRKNIDQSDSYFNFAQSNQSSPHMKPHLQSSRTGKLSRRSTGLGLDTPGEISLDHEDELQGDDAEEDDLMADSLDEANVLTEDLLGAEKGELETPDMGPTLGEALKRSEAGTKLIRFDDLPFWWRNNEHIFTGYRFIPLHAKTGPIPLIKSAFTWHNETVNIHSHFIPTLFILLAGIPLIIYKSPLPDAHPLDTVILVLYLFAASSCLSSSALWHVLSGCASLKWFEWGACVDYIGISWLIAASFGTVVYDGFYCQPKTVVFYCSLNALCGALGSYLPFQRWFNERKHKNWRIAFFLFLNFTMVAPLFQMCYQHGYSKALAFGAPFVRSIMCYVTGLLFYAFHFPEMVWPGKFDYWFQSHQLWHAAIVLAITQHYSAIFQAHAARYDYSCAAVDAGRPIGEVVEGILKGLWGSSTSGAAAR